MNSKDKKKKNKFNKEEIINHIKQGGSISSIFDFFKNNAETIKNIADASGKVIDSGGKAIDSTLNAV